MHFSFKLYSIYVRFKVRKSIKLFLLQDVSVSAKTIKFLSILKLGAIKLSCTIFIILKAQLI